MELKGVNIHNRMKHFKVPGVSIAQITNGEISSKGVYGVVEAETNIMVNSDSIFNACSISKFVTAILVLKLTEQGFLDLDEDVNNKLISWKVPENEFTHNNKVTLRLLLSHQSGIVDPKGSFEELDSTLGIPTMVDILEGATVYCTESIEVKYEPGSSFEYSDAGYCIIEQLIEDISGKPYKLLMDELIFEPLHMKNSTFEHAIPNLGRDNFTSGHNRDGKLKDKYPIYPYPAAAGLWTTPTDLSMLIIELINSLNGNSKLGLTKSKIEDMITPQGCSSSTGLGVFLGNTDQVSSLGWGVGFQCMLVAYPYLKMGTVIMTNIELGIHQTEGIIGEILESIT